jgi:hypothetical protein
VAQHLSSIAVSLVAVASWPLLAPHAHAGARVAQGTDRGPQNGPDVDHFESKVRPLLAQHCYECHSDASARPKGRLRVDSRAALLEGGSSGPALVPGDVEGSLLVEAVRYGSDVQMPPKGKLSDAEVAIFEEWVRRGAAFPESAAADSGAGPEEGAPAGIVAAKASELWSLAPLGGEQPPAVADDSWCVNEVDLFVRERHEALGLEPAPRAERRTLLRRLSLDLTGLPPTLEELEQFERDAKPDAWARQIDRLLASPHYGERWGRYWLDLARYSDSNGLDENLAMSHAWRYRDWVVRALNQDLPYDQFATWQIAGDLLPAPADEQELRDRIAATGFLVLGPKMLAEQDKEKLSFDIVDEQMDVACRTFLGLTMGCARCHDHKFDPISQADYYSLAGVFKSTATMANFDFVSGWNERELGPAAAIEARRAHVAKLEAARGELERLRKDADEALLRAWSADTARYLLAASNASRGALVLEAEEQSRGNLIVDDKTYGSAQTVVTRTGSGGQQFAEFDVTFATAGRRQLEVRMAALESRPVRLLVDGELVRDAALGDTTGSWNPDGQRWVRVGVLELRAGRNVLRIERDGAMPHFDKLALVDVPAGRESSAWPVEGNVWAAGLAPEIVRAWTLAMMANARREDPVFALWHAFAKLEGESFEADAAELVERLRAERDAGKLATWNPHVLGLLDGLAPSTLRELAGRYQALFSTAEVAWRERRSEGDKKVEKLDDAGLEGLRLVLRGGDSPLRLSTDAMAPHYGDDDRAAIAAARAAAEELERTLPAEFERALAVRDAKEVGDLPLFRRGSHLDKEGDPLPRRFFTALELDGESPPIPAGASGRLEFARWMFDARNPLTARVIANRLWQGHFGRGLVASSSNFGARGDRPTHPGLLDWLARELVRRDWSLKSLHRTICLSAAYRMSTRDDAAARALDPENLALWRFERRRMDAETLRDNVLALSGKLERELGGTLMALANRGYVTNDQSNDSTRYDSPRRSIYLPIIRNAMFDLFSAFDYPDPSVTVDVRPSTTSPAQALYLMNSPLLHSASATLAAATAPVGDARERIAELYRRALLREPTERETARALAFVLDQTQPEGARVAANVGEAPAPTPPPARDPWRELAQVLFSSSEFLYID